MEKRETEICLEDAACLVYGDYCRSCIGFEWQQSVEEGFNRAYSNLKKDFPPRQEHQN